MTTRDVTTVISPIAENQPAAIRAGGRLPSVRNATLALIDSGRPGSDLIMRGLAQALRDAGAGSVTIHRKYAPTVFTADARLDELVGEADGVVFGVVD